MINWFLYVKAKEEMGSPPRKSGERVEACRPLWQRRWPRRLRAALRWCHCHCTGRSCKEALCRLESGAQHLRVHGQEVLHRPCAQHTQGRRSGGERPVGPITRIGFLQHRRLGEAATAAHIASSPP